MNAYSRAVGVALVCMFVVMAGCTGGLGTNPTDEGDESDGADGRAALDSLFVVEVIFGDRDPEVYRADGVMLINRNDNRAIDITGITIEAGGQRTTVDREAVIEPTFDRTVLFDERAFDRENGGTITVYDADGDVLLEEVYGPRESAAERSEDRGEHAGDARAMPPA